MFAASGWLASTLSRFQNLTSNEFEYFIYTVTIREMIRLELLKRVVRAIVEDAKKKIGLDEIVMFQETKIGNLKYVECVSDDTIFPPLMLLQ